MSGFSASRPARLLCVLKTFWLLLLKAHFVFWPLKVPTCFRRLVAPRRPRIYLKLYFCSAPLTRPPSDGLTLSSGHFFTCLYAGVLLVSLRGFVVFDVRNRSLILYICKCSTLKFYTMFCIELRIYAYREKRITFSLYIKKFE